MDSCDAVEREIEKVIKKFTEIKEESVSTIDEVTERVQFMKNSISKFHCVYKNIQPTGCIEKLIFFKCLILFAGSLNEITPDQILELRNVIKRSKLKLQQIAALHRSLHLNVSKVGKAIDRNFTPDYHSIAPIDLFECDKYLEILNQVIAEHFYRQGMNDVADTLIRESCLPPEEDIHLELFADLYQMWEAITNKNLGPALKWATQYSSELDARNSSLEFKLHRLAYLQLLESGMAAQTDAIAYTRTHFNKFINRFEKEIQILMGCLIYLPSGFQNTPYSHLFDSDMWMDAADSFIKEACEIVGVNKDSSLEIIVNSGCFALPGLMNLKQIMMKSRVSGVWSGRNELPVSI